MQLGVGFLHLSFTAILVKVTASSATQTLRWLPIVCPNMAEFFTFMIVLTFKWGGIVVKALCY